ncbi:unnamed protein product [Rotaria sordida]|uniref:Rap-GAP domain-containing protein n=1 Tax=Rotaria sordida TaxID=392033 RepID=A0A813NQS5_9BILA|nr:unnamed protein product [Rotaria sordida]
MQSSHTTHDLYQEDNECNKHKPVKHVRSHDIDYQKHQRQQKQRQHSPFGSHSAMSSSFRHSIRNLTSCASLSLTKYTIIIMLKSLRRRRKSSRTPENVHHNSSKTEATSVLEDNHQQPSKPLLMPKRSFSSSPSSNKNKCRTESTISSAGNNTSSSVKTHKSSNEKKNVEISNTSAFNSSLQVKSTTKDDILLSNSRTLSSKEISTSLVNLMGTASNSAPIDNTTQMPTREIRPRKDSVLSLIQHISSTPAAPVERIGYFESSSNVSSPYMAESSSSQQIVYTGNNHFGNLASTSYTKLTNHYTWCYESSASIQTNSGTSFDECLPCLETDDKPLIYREQFESTEHFNWYGISDIHGPVIISYKYSNDQDKQRYVMAILRARQRTSIESLLDIPSSLSSIDILRRICDQCGITDIEYFDPVLCDGSHDLLIKYDESYVSKTHKFGIIYQRENQLTEEDIFSNETHSIAMDNFLDFIGNRVKLKDFQGFRGGLDVKSDHTGTESIYEQFNNHEIMFHVSTLLPHSKIERQQLERKRHIGNDIVAIVFQENETIFNPECIASQFLHVYIVVTPLDNDGTRFKVSVIRRDSVPLFGPFLNHSNVFYCDQIFKQWLLIKLINAEMASYKASTFQKYQERTKMNLFENLYHTLHDNNRPFMNFIFNHSQYKHECDIEQQKEDAQSYSSTKIYDRHADNSLLGSVRRRFIAPKLRAQHSVTPPPTTIIVSTPSSNNISDLKSKANSMTMDLKQSASKESITNICTNGKISSTFFLPKNQIPQMEKSNTNYSLLEPENVDSSSSSGSNSKFLSPTAYLSTPSNHFNHKVDSYSPTSSFNFNKLSIDDIDHNQLLLDDLQSSSRDDLIKFVVALQQQHATKLAQMDENHSKALKQLEIQLIQQQHIVDGDSS